MCAGPVTRAESLRRRAAEATRSPAHDSDDESAASSDSEPEEEYVEEGDEEGDEAADEEAQEGEDESDCEDEGHHASESDDEFIPDVQEEAAARVRTRSRREEGQDQESLESRLWEACPDSQFPTLMTHDIYLSVISLIFELYYLNFQISS